MRPIVLRTNSAVCICAVHAASLGRSALQPSYPAPQMTTHRCPTESSRWIIGDAAGNRPGTPSQAKHDTTWLTLRVTVTLFWNRATRSPSVLIDELAAAWLRLADWRWRRTTLVRPRSSAQKTGSDLTRCRMHAHCATGCRIDQKITRGYTTTTLVVVGAEDARPRRCARLEFNVAS